MMGSCHLFVFILLGYSGTHHVLAALPDLVVRLSPAATSPSDSLTINSNDDTSIEFLAKRAQFGSRDRLLEGRLVHPPGYDFFLCERFRSTIDVRQDGQVSVVALPPYTKPIEGDSTVLLVPRGECSFERKAYAAKHFYGAKAILIYDRLGARYTWNTTSDRVNFPEAKFDYECANGYSMIYDLPLDPPAYNGTQLDPVMGFATKMPTKPAASSSMSDHEELSGKGSDAGLAVGMTTVCNLTNTALKPCESQLCLVTSHLQNSSNYPVCCAWDTPVTMPDADDAKDLDTADILAVWITIRQSELIFQSDFLSSGAEVSIKRRGSSSAFNVTYIFMWIWGTLVTLVGAWYAAGEYRRFGAKLTAYKASEDSKRASDRSNGSSRPRRKSSGQPNVHRVSERDEPASLEMKPWANDRPGKFNNEESHIDLENGKPSFQVEMDGKIVGKNPQQPNRKKQNTKMKKAKKRTTEPTNEVWSLRSLPPPERKSRQKRPPHNMNNRPDNNAGINQPNIEDEVGNESPIVPARESGTIAALEMSHWHVFSFILIMSLALILLYFFPGMYTVIFIILGLVCAGAASHLIINPLITTVIPKLGECWVEEFNKPVMCGCNGFSIAGNLITYIWAVVWIWYGITHYRPQTNAFFWITLDIYGACLCVMTLSVLKLNAIKIATLLMVVIFFYDIFFVFITTFFTGGISVMLKVFGGSENPNGEDFCYKYPDERYCKGVSFFPVIFMLPRANDYASGSVILGWGDIIWPGFLIAFCARHDEAARLLGAHASFPDIKSPTKWYEGYFFPMMIAYALGLFFAYLAVILTEQGQPALLYICPSCLATIFILGRGEIKDLWNGSRVLKLAGGLMTKTERNWGEARMKQFAEQMRRRNTERAPAAKNDIDPRQHSTGRSAEILSENPNERPTGSTPSKNIQPRSKDVCFGHEDHPGTRALRKVAEEVAADLGHEEFKPEIYQIIRKKLKGRRFFMTKNIVWEEASKLETRKQIGRAYDHCRGRRSNALKDPLPVASIT